MHPEKPAVGRDGSRNPSNQMRPRIWGFKGWQWLFFLKGIPGVLLTFVVLRVLPDTPQTASWSTVGERKWPADELEKDVRASPAAGKDGTHLSIVQVFKHPAILALCVIYFCATATNLGVSLFLPQIVKQQGSATCRPG